HSPKTKMKQVTTLLMLLALGGCVTEPQKGNFDLGRMIGGEPLWQKIDQNLPQVQQLVDRTKERCMEKLEIAPPQRSLIREPNPTAKEKCLIECVLTGIDMMDSKTRQLNIKRVSELTSLVTENNKLAIAMSAGSAQACNRCVTTSDPCEAAHLLNQCIGRQLQLYKVNLKW
ncbi:hypothetical protein KR222_003248, partial [Zaprionus bogoriensis]